MGSTRSEVTQATLDGIREQRLADLLTQLRKEIIVALKRPWKSSSIRPSERCADAVMEVVGPHVGRLDRQLSDFIEGWLELSAHTDQTCEAARRLDRVGELSARWAQEPEMARAVRELNGALEPPE